MKKTLQVKNSKRYNTGTDNKNAQIRSVGRSADAVYRDVECRCGSVDYFNNLINSKIKIVIFF